MASSTTTKYADDVTGIDRPMRSRLPAPADSKFTTTSIRCEKDLKERFSEVVQEDGRTMSSELRLYMRKRVADADDA